MGYQLRLVQTPYYGATLARRLIQTEYRVSSLSKSALILAHHFRPSVEACPNQANVSFAVGDFFKPDTISKAELYVLSQHIHGLTTIGRK
ncbi:unnamed protein product [Porites evermanni]|uniref:Uncharacterized protein n=1 Tax=Porites evermanni TaxID=104178 RepID=A0ABN8MAN6_9CNID|nr:unnamed protein product [Porites evermanni]